MSGAVGLWVIVYSCAKSVKTKDMRAEQYFDRKCILNAMRNENIFICQSWMRVDVVSDVWIVDS